MYMGREFLADWAKAVCETVALEQLIADLDELSREDGPDATVQWYRGVVRTEERLDA